MKWRYGKGFADKIIVLWLFSSVFFFIASATSHGASICSDCHGMPPIDAAYRNITTGGFKGNHQTHQPAAATPANCEPCHTGSSAYVSGHEDGVITIAANINNSPLTATYSKGVFFNQTSLPVLGTCASVNCHFEAVTPVWGSAPLIAPSGCSICHSNPPSDGNHPAITGAGKKHGDYYGTSTTSCGKCHSDHTVEAKPFAHATSAGHRGIVLSFSAAPNSGGSYSKTANLAYPSYLPSQTTAANRNGTCSSMYCHSDGNGGAPVTVPAWGTTLAADCTGCHGGAAGSASVIASGKHPAHINNAAVLGSNFGCADCHAKTVSGNLTVATIANHVNALKDYSGARAGGSARYSVTAKTCTNIYCHSSGKGSYVNPAAWNSTATVGCNGCHGTSNSFGIPDYANGGAGAVLANSHAKHATVAADCEKCHLGTTATGSAIATGSPLHVNGAIDVTFDTAKAGTGATWSAAAKSCANTTCHSTSAPVWGGALPADCTGCHGNDPASAAPIATGKHAAHINNAAVLGTSNNFGCVDCHAKTVSGNRTISNSTLHVNGFVDYSGTRAGGSAKYNSTSKLCSNIYCHSNGNLTAIVYANPAAWNSTATYGCNGCHGTSNATTGAPDYANGGAVTATANSHPKHVAGAGINDTRGCVNCHVRTVDAGTAGKLRNYSTLHLNGQSNVYFSAAIGGSFNSAAMTCSATYCHGTAASPAWGSASLACNACHAANNTLPGAHGIHYASATLAGKFVNFSGNVSTSGVYRFTCSSCHASGAGKATHAGGLANANGAAEVFYGYTTAAQKGSYTYGVTQGTDNGFKWTNGGTGCNTSYCHGNGQGGNGLTAVSWSTTVGSGTCVQCHDTKQTGATASKLSGKHDAHMNPTINTALGLGNGFNCVDCHAKTVSSNTVISDKSRHVNKFVDYSGVKAGGSTKYNRTTKQCSNIYCHSNGNPSAIVYVNPPAWNSATTLGCNGCHGTTSAIGAPDYASGGAVPSATANSHTKHVAGAADTTVCATCHAKTANMTAANRFKDYTAVSYHLNGTPNIYFNTAKAGTTATWTPASGTCSNVTCHGGSGSTAVWGATLNCQDCHGNGSSASVADFGATFWNNGVASKFQMTGTGSWADTGHGRPTASGAYAGSANPAANFSGIVNFCEWCHDATVGHNVSSNPFRLRNLADAAWGKNGVCMSCHATGSVGVTVGGQLRVASVASQVNGYHYGAKHSTALSGGQFCWDCHDPHGTGTTNQFMIRPKVAVSSDATTGAPTAQSTTSVVFTLSATPTGTDYAKSAAPFNGICNVCHTTTSHYTTTAGDSHNSGTRCISCHAHNGDGTNKNTAFTPSGAAHAVPFYAHATPPFTSCAGCHNTSAAGPYPAATAGSPPNCRGCHLAADPTVTSSGCTSCHASPPSGTTHPNLVGSHVKHGTLAGAPAACAICHNGAGSGSGANHGPGNKGTNPAVDNIIFTAAQAGASATWDTATKTCTNTYCHGATLTGGGTTKNPTWGTTLTGCGTCHGDPPATSTHTGVTVTQCITCHPHVNAAGTGFTDATKHMNGVIDASGGVSAGGSNCYTCHSSFQSAMDATGATRTAAYHHVLGGAAGNGDIAPNAGSYQTSTTDVYCTSCHADHNYFNNGGTVSTKAANLRSDITNASAAAPVNTDFLTTGSFGICVSCHSASLTRDTVNQKAGGVATTPVIAGASFTASMHNYTTISSFGTQNFAANCVKCHTDEQAKDKQTSTNKFGPHFSASVSLLDDLGAGTVAQYREQYICFRCHSQTSDTSLGGTLKPVNGKDWFGSSTMRSFAEDTFKSFTSAGRSPRHRVTAYTGLHKVNETRADIAANKHVECADCHNPHAVKFGNHSTTVPGTAKGSRAATLANVLTGATGVSVTTWAANWAGVTAYNPSTTTAPLVTATAEWQVCFKCHSGANANVATWGGAATTAAAFTDLALEFNPNNASGHPVVAALPTANRLTAAKLKGGWVPGSVMTCSDCHATDSTASKGPHGSSVKWMLAGTNKAWPYTSAAANGTSTGTFFRIATYSTGNGTKDGLFCLNCHTVTGSNNWHSQSNITGGQHGGSATGPPVCVNCHIRVPHGGKISRLLQTTNAPVRYRANGSSGTPLFGAWGATTANIKGSTFSNANFKSSCSEHSSGGTGGEAW